MKKLGSFISFVCIDNLLTLAGFVGFLLATGRLDKAKAQAVSDLLQHQGTPAELRIKLNDIIVAATQTQPATATAPGEHTGLAGAADVPGTAEERIDYVKKVLEQERLALENDKQFLRDQHKLLDQRQESLAAAEAAFAEKSKAYEQKLASANTTNDRAGFQKTMSMFSELKPKQVKDLLAVMPAEDVARYLTTMEPDRAAKIMAEFKSADEKSLLKAVLDNVRGVGKGSGTGAALPTAAGAVSPASSGLAGP